MASLGEQESDCGIARKRPVSRAGVFNLCSIMDSADGSPAAPPHATATAHFQTCFTDLWLALIWVIFYLSCSVGKTLPTSNSIFAYRATLLCRCDFLIGMPALKIPQWVRMEKPQLEECSVRQFSQWIQDCAVAKDCSEESTAE